jgi:GMP synthase (glutamine-hydrolysing)
MTPRILIVEFEPDCHPGRVGTYLESAGAEIHLSRLYRGEPLPDLRACDGLMPLGGTISAEDDHNHPYLKDVVALLQDACATGTPTLGVCLGGQLLARALGARIWRKPRPEIGFFPIQLTAAGQRDALFRGFGDDLMAFQWHEDAFDVPAGAELLADSQRDSAQAFRYGSCYGLQFHPEVTSESIAQWAAWVPAGLSAAAEPTSRDALLVRAGEVDAEFAAQTARLCENWLAIVEQRVASSRF